MNTITTQDKVERPLLRYYGGKWRLASWIISFFPQHECYVEPYGGGAGVLLRKEPSFTEVYNDLDGEVTNFFHMIRDCPKELARLLRYTPYSRDEFETSYKPASEPLEQARRFFVRSWQGYGGPRKMRLTGWKIQKRRWMGGRGDQLTEWEKAKQIMRAARRFRKVQIEQDDALQVILRFDTPETLFYCDPPYVSESRNARWAKRAYTLEVDGQHHLHLINLLNQIKGMAIVSAYPSDGYEELFKGWVKEERTAQTMNKTIATEVLWLSPKLVERL